ncbi:uromodulin isoform X2 [Alligator mississippiensis]|uniref:Uromodulin-like n=1 Tax=Alligator mississippiensis TaxID=8496 RepID=A0A151MSH6_ALLMI|nr:uromodulin isoform X2 [Alligator mississippiensis]KYO27473.1 uromodulin-like [Alligator mississippiensis]
MAVHLWGATVTFWMLMSALWLAGSESYHTDLKKLHGRMGEAVLRPKRSPRVCWPNPCKHQGECQRVEEKSPCICKPGFTGPFCQDVVLKLTCEEDHMKMMVRKEAFSLLRIPLALVHLKNSTCKVSEKEEGGATFFAATLTGKNHTVCGSVIRQNTSHVSYSNVIESDREVQGVISRSVILRLNFTCVYAYEQVVGLPFSLTAIDMQVQFIVKEGKFNVTMNLYKTSSYMEPYQQQPAVLPVTETLYVLLQLVGQNLLRYFLLSIKDCWTTPTADPNQEVRHQLILKGCPHDETVTYISAIGNSTMAKFSFLLFKFTNYSEVFLHCQVQLCHPDGPEPCIRECPRKFKRKRSLEDDYRKIVSYGPIHLLASSLSGAQDVDSSRERQDVWAAHLWIPGAAVMLCAVGLSILVAVVIVMKKRVI